MAAARTHTEEGRESSNSVPVVARSPHPRNPTSLSLVLFSLHDVHSSAQPPPYIAADDGDDDSDASSLLESLLLGRRRGGLDRASTSSLGDHDHHPASTHPADVRWRALAATDLDAFLARVYRYWDENGLAVIVTSRLLNLAALAFTAAFSTLALLVVRWDRLGAPCIRDGTCDIAAAALDWHPFSGPGKPTPWAVGCGAYLGAFGLYWAGAATHVAVDLVATLSVARFYRSVLGLSERQIVAVPWAEVARRIVEAQRSGRLVLVAGPPGGRPVILTEADLVSRIMRRDNFLIALLGAGVLALTPPRPGPALATLPLPAWLAEAGWFGEPAAPSSLTIRLPPLGPRRPALPRVLECNLRACVLDPLFGGGDTIRPAVAADPAALAARFRRAALLNVLAAPFAALFLSTWGFMRHAERFYHHPSSAAARRWSPLAYWALREVNELPHYVDHRLDGAAGAAEWYVSQFPSHAAAHVARFVAFVTGSLAALLLLAAALDDRLLESPLYGRHVVWWVAGLGLVLAAARGVAGDGPAAEAGSRAPEPERALAADSAATHYRPRHWRGRAHAREVRGEVGRLFRYRAALFAQEVGAVALAPALLWWALPACAPAVCAFVREHTVHVPGVGDVVALAAWGGEGGGEAAAAAATPVEGARASAEAGPAPPPPAARAASRRQGKLDASIVSFGAAYPTWCPPAGSAAARLLAAVAARVGGGGGGEGPAPPPPPPAAAAAPGGVNPAAAAASTWTAWGWAAGGGIGHLGPHGGGGAAKSGAATAAVHHPPAAGQAAAFGLAPAAAADDHGRIALCHLALQSLYDEQDAAAARGTGGAAREVVAWPPEEGERAGAGAAEAPVATSARLPHHPPASAPRPTPPSAASPAWPGSHIADSLHREHELATVASWSGGGGGGGGGGGPEHGPGRRAGCVGVSPGTPSPPCGGAFLTAPSADGGLTSADPGLVMPPPPSPPPPPPGDWGGGSGGVFGAPSDLGGSGSGASSGHAAAAAAAAASWSAPPPPDLGLEGTGQRQGWGRNDGGPPDLI